MTSDTQLHFSEQGCVNIIILRNDSTQRESSPFNHVVPPPWGRSGKHLKGPMAAPPTHLLLFPDLNWFFEVCVLHSNTRLNELGQCLRKLAPNEKRIMAASDFPHAKYNFKEKKEIYLVSDLLICF